MPPFIAELLQAIADTPLAALLRSSVAVYAPLNAAHILSIGLVVGSIATLDLRVLGFFREVPFGALARPLSRVAAAGVLLAIVTGLLLFSVRPLTYAENPAFLAKISLVVIGIANALHLRASPRWRAALESDSGTHNAVERGAERGNGLEDETPNRRSTSSMHGKIGMHLKIGAVISLLTWTSAIFAGRWIGFLQ